MKYVFTFEEFQSNSDNNEPYYHGTNKEDAGLKIIESGMIKPGNVDSEKIRKSFLPMYNRVYLGSALRESVIYSLGGVMMGHDPWKNDIATNRFGYLFSIDSKELNNPLPDEDYVGMLASAVMQQSHNKKYIDDVGMVIYSKLTNYAKEALLLICKTKLTPTQQKNLLYGDYAHYTVIGKKLIKLLIDNHMYILKEIVKSKTCPISTEGPIKFINAWKIDKTRSKEIKDDCSNFFDVAETVE